MDELDPVEHVHFTNAKCTKERRSNIISENSRRTDIVIFVLKKERDFLFDDNVC
jgi:hypothetical protein